MLNNNIEYSYYIVNIICLQIHIYILKIYQIVRKYKYT